MPSGKINTKNESKITAEDVRRIFQYRDGNLYRGNDYCIAGTPQKQGYIRIYVLGHVFAAHRLTWLFHNGEWPDGQIDHINGIRDDNRIENLRIATHNENMRNSKINKNHKIGLKGVTFEKGSYRVKINLKGKSIHLGVFNTPEEAHKAYCKAADEQFGEFARHA